MDTQFNVFEILRIAEEIEHKAAKFYLKAAGQFADARRRDLCYDLASWRVKHERAWIRLRQEYSDRTGEFGTFDPDNYVRSNPHVMASLPWFGPGCGSQNGLTGYEDATQIVRDALRRAEAVWIFYRGLKEFACDPAARRMIDAMIAEEDRHIRQLNRSLDQMLGRSGDFDRRTRSGSVGTANHR